MQGIKIASVILLLFLGTSGSSAGSDQLAKYETMMAASQDSISSGATYEIRRAASDHFREVLILALNTEGCFEYPFDQLKTVSTIISPDETFRIFNWNLPSDDETHQYFCFVLNWDKKSKMSSWEEVIDQPKEINKIENKYLKPDQWLGAIYYEIIPVKISKSKTYYTLLGWDGNNRTTTRKIIDVISFDGGKIKFGAPVFKTDHGTQKRIIIEYASTAMVSLKWREKEKRIVFDHVSPRDPSMTGIYSYYGPDLTFDSFELEKGKWIFNSNVEVRNDKNDKRYNDPTKIK